MTTHTYLTEQAVSPFVFGNHCTIAPSDIQSRSVETNSRTCYERWIFRGRPTNPNVVIWHPDDWGFEVSKPINLFLRLIDKEITNNPDALIPADEAQINRLQRLLKDVEV